ncbi:MAG: leucine--tRNA ligase [Candidatus Diapherotrites archaeon]|nr:leucine--tRNA ligase [Candidatus Diapherotrites archaeon]
MGVDFKKLESKWQKKWAIAEVFKSRPAKGKKKFYCLEMFPYPSGSGLHMGHAFNYTIGDIYARFKRMQGYNVLYPMGYDALGLPAENAAIKAGVHPKKHTADAIKNFVNQQKLLGLSYDWERMVVTYEPNYYAWNQHLFLDLYDTGLVYKEKAPANWCPKCETVLANEQVHSGHCWRHPDTEVETKNLEQWFIKTTAYADELLEGLEEVDWPERIKAMQRNWIGKSSGIELDFPIIDSEKTLSIFTTRPDTCYGITFMVLAPEHPWLEELVAGNENKKEILAFAKELAKADEITRTAEGKEKRGMFIGRYCTNPFTNAAVPIFIGEFVLAHYGTGAIMAVPAHDQRDFEFAKKHDIPIKVVIQPKGTRLDEATMKRAFVDAGILINSGEFDGVNNIEAIELISDFAEANGFGTRKINYKLRDWLVSRQRYWGTPIPIVYCAKCGIVPVPKKDLPVLLPEKVKFGFGNPLETSKEFVETKCPKCRGKATRETDTMDTFFDSSWYFLRFCDPKNKLKPFDRKRTDYWMPVDQYIGGAEHACMHLIYARFFTKALRDIGYFSIDEPFSKLFNQGMLHGEDGFVMSKSRGNVVNPIEMIEKYSADILRFYLVSIASPDKDMVWSDKGIESSAKFVNKIYNYFGGIKKGKSTPRIESKLNKTLKEVTVHIENFEYNNAILKLRQLFDSLGKTESKQTLGVFLQMISVFCPHIAEELWAKLGNKKMVSTEKWPKAEEKKINEQFEKEDNAIEQLVNDLNHVKGIVQSKGKKPKSAFVYTIPKEKELFSGQIESLENRTGLKISVFAVNDKGKRDPENKAAKAKPLKPAIFME